MKKKAKKKDMYIGALLCINDIVDVLSSDEFEDIFLEKMPYGLPLIRMIEYH